MEKHFCFAGVEISASIPSGYEHYDDRLLAAFRVDAVQAAHHFSFEFAEELPAPDLPLWSRQPSFSVYGDHEKQIRNIGAVNDPHIRVLHNGTRHHVLLKKSSYQDGISAKTLLNAMAAEHLVAQNDGFVFHCSYIDINGEAILFTAPSGTGKSTQAELWRKHRDAEIINGDRAVVRMTQEVLFACGIPFAGSSQYCINRTLPIKAIVYLSQAPKTTTCRLHGYEAFRRLWEGVSVNTWDEIDIDLVSRVVQRAVAQVPVFYMPCTPDETAVTALELALRKLEQ